MTAGFSLPAGGAEIVELSSVSGENGVRRPAEEAGLRAGDLLCAADRIAIGSIEDLTAALERSGGKQTVFTVLRDGERLDVPVTPAKDKKTGKWKIGVLIRDMLSGIGTITYIEKESLHFGALGHGVSERPLSDASKAKVFACSVIGVNKGTRGKAGELKGLFLNDRTIARAELFCGTGLFGTFDGSYDFSLCETAQIAPVQQPIKVCHGHHRVVRKCGRTAKQLKFCSFYREMFIHRAYHVSGNSSKQHLIPHLIMCFELEKKKATVEGRWLGPHVFTTE